MSEQIEKALVNLLRNNLNKLEEELIYKWEDATIKNKVRSITERIHVTIENKIGAIGIYGDLISKYGINFSYLASEEEKANCRYDFRRKGVQRIEYILNQDFQLLKIKALENIVSKYITKLKTNENESDRIIRVVQFITTEKHKIKANLTRI